MKKAVAGLWAVIGVWIGEPVLGALASKPTGNMPVVDGWVQAIAERDGTVYIGGKFARIGPWSGSGALVDANTGNIIEDFPKFNGIVWSAVSDGAGGYFIAGDFTEVGGVARPGFVHITPQRKVDVGWNPVGAGRVNKMILQGDRLYYAYSDESSGSLPANVGAIDRVTGQVLSFKLNLQGRINALAANADRIFVGGYLTDGSFFGDMLRAYDLSGTKLNWNPNVDREVYALGLSGDTLYVQGDLSSIGGQSRNSIGAVSASTGAVLSWNPAPSPYGVGRMVLQDGVLAVYGDFTAIGGEARTSFAAFDAATGDLLPVQAAETAFYTSAMGVGTDWIAFGGYPIFTYDFARDKLFVLIDRQTGATRTINFMPNFTVLTIAPNGSEFFFGGMFSMVKPQMRIGAAAFDAATGQVTDWNPNATTNVLALAVTSDRVFIAGELKSVGGQPRKALAAVDRVAGAPFPGWTTDASTWINSLGIYNDQLYVGGAFTNIGGLVRTNIAALDINTGAVLPWNPEVNRSMVRALTISGDTLYIGGLFRSIGGVTRRVLASFDLLTGQLTDWNPFGTSTGNVDDIEVSNGVVYVGGRFNSIGGVSRTNAAAISLSGEILPWAPNPTGAVYDLAISGDTVFMTGEFSIINGAKRGYIAGVSASTGENIDWDPNIEFFGNCVTVANNRLYVGGVFYTQFDEARLGLSGYELADVPIEYPNMNSSSFTIADGTVQFNVTADSRIVVTPQVSEDLVSWTDLPAVDASGIVQDQTAGSRRVSFYRLKSVAR
jgi:hypothetical protein